MEIIRDNIEEFYITVRLIIKRYFLIFKFTSTIFIIFIVVFLFVGRLNKEPKKERTYYKYNDNFYKLIKNKILFPYAMTKEKVVTLTFDDGPSTKYRPLILKILKKEKIKATFFDLGWKLEENPVLAQRTIKEGHEIANHTYSHRTLTKLSFIKKKLELRMTQKAIFNVTGEQNHLFRPPGGIYDAETTTVAKNLGLITVLWTTDPGDYHSDNPVLSPSPEFIKLKVNYTIFPGGIILLHDGTDKTIEVLPGIIQNLKKLGYKFVKVSELIELDSKK